MLALLLLMADDANRLIETARARSAVDHRCVYSTDSTDITVCGLRNADRFRVPIIVHDPGDPRHEGVPAERQRLFARTTPIDELSPFLVGGGMAGVSAGVSSDGTPTFRPLAP